MYSPWNTLATFVINIDGTLNPVYTMWATRGGFPITVDRYRTLQALATVGTMIERVVPQLWKGEPISQEAYQYLQDIEQISETCFQKKMVFH